MKKASFQQSAIGFKPKATKTSVTGGKARF
jgi:hypothetical protein